MENLLCDLEAEEENLTRFVEYLPKDTYVSQKRTKCLAMEKDPLYCGHQRNVTSNNTKGIEGHAGGVPKKNVFSVTFPV